MSKRRITKKSTSDCTSVKRRKFSDRYYEDSTSNYGRAIYYNPKTNQIHEIELNLDCWKVIVEMGFKRNTKKDYENGYSWSLSTLMSLSMTSKNLAPLLMMCFWRPLIEHMTQNEAKVIIIKHPEGKGSIDVSACYNMRHFSRKKGGVKICMSCIQTWPCLDLNHWPENTSQHTVVPVRTGECVNPIKFTFSKIEIPESCINYNDYFETIESYSSFNLNFKNSNEEEEDDEDLKYYPETTVSNPYILKISRTSPQGIRCIEEQEEILQSGPCTKMLDPGNVFSLLTSVWYGKHEKSSDFVPCSSSFELCTKDQEEITSKSRWEPEHSIRNLRKLYKELSRK